MSTITKVFVVLTLLLSIVYCVAAAFLFAYSSNYREMYESEKDAHEQTTDEKDKQISSLDSKVTGYKEQIEALEKNNDTLEDERDDAQGKLDEKQRQFDDLDRSYKTLNETLVTLARTADDLKDQLKTSHDKVDELKDKLTEADEKNNSLTKELAVKEDDNDKLSKKMVATLKELNKSVETIKEQTNILKRIEDAGFEIPDVVVVHDPIHGRILAVDAETDIVVISIGANAHVTKGMKLSVYRDDRFVGSISVISVFPDMSSARIIRNLTQMEVQPGDNVTNIF